MDDKNKINHNNMSMNGTKISYSRRRTKYERGRGKGVSNLILIRAKPNFYAHKIELIKEEKKYIYS